MIDEADITGTVVLLGSDLFKCNRAKMDAYSLMRPNAAAFTGLKLKLLVALAEYPALSPIIQLVLRSRILPRLFQILRTETYAEEPRASAILPDWIGAEEEVVVDSLDAHARLEAALHSLDHAGTTLVSTAANARPTVLDYHYAYEHGMVTPSQVAERLIDFLLRHNPKHHWLSAWSAEHIRSQAAAASARYAAGASRSVFDGVPFVVKDSIDALPYETSFGTTFMGKLHPVKSDAPCVAVLRELGAVLLGKAALNEFGAMCHGFNTHAGATLNPHDPSRMSGGSSSGAAAAVAVGLCPIAIGTDGGGSIRIPSSLCGVVGLKPTKGRLADDHAAHGGYSSMVVSGPIAGSVADATLLYSIMANINYPTAAAADRYDACSNCTAAQKTASSLPSLAAAAAAAAAAAPLPPKPLGLPKALLPLHEGSSVNGEYVVEGLKPLQGLRVGVYKQWAGDCSPGVGEVLQQSLARLQQLGAAVVDISLPELELVQAGHLATFVKEMAADGEQAGWMNDWSLRYQLNLDTRMFFTNASSFTDEDYTQAQRLRARVLGHFERAFKQCDAIITPATPTTAPRIPPEAHTTGVYDLESNFTMIRFTQAANLTGLPAIVMPGGRHMGMGLPVGVQFMGRPWSESTLLRTAAALEQHLLEDGVPHPVPSLLINPIACDKGVHPKAKELTRKLWAKRYSSSNKK